MNEHEPQHKEKIDMHAYLKLINDYLNHTNTEKAGIYILLQSSLRSKTKLPQVGHSRCRLIRPGPSQHCGKTTRGRSGLIPRVPPVRMVPFVVSVPRANHRSSQSIEIIPVTHRGIRQGECRRLLNVSTRTLRNHTLRGKVQKESDRGVSPGERKKRKEEFTLLSTVGTHDQTPRPRKST